MHKSVLKICSECKEEFLAKRPEIKTCSNNCKSKLLSSSHVDQKPKNLQKFLQIGSKTRFKKGHVGYKTMLGKKHTSDAKKKISQGHKLNPSKFWQGKKRPEIGKKISAKLKGRKLSIERRIAISKSAVRGKDHKWWRGGITKLYAEVRHCLEYKLWREAVFKRDDYICVFCSYGKGHILEADHIIPFSKLIHDFTIKTLTEAKKCKELWNIENGRTLCRACHKKTETYLNKRWRDSAPLVGEEYKKS